jgi:aspartate-semialdehyde dehydrogenase
MKIGLIGSTGLVGQTILKILEERNFPVSNLKPFASKSSLGKNISFKNKNYPVDVLTTESIKNLDLVFIATGEDISEEWTPKLAALNTFVIDNSSAFRMHPEVPLICAEVNKDFISQDQKIYANPNCSTIQLVVLLNALKTIGELKDVTVASYQAVSGGGTAALEELKEQTKNTNTPPKAFPKQIAFNCIPQIGGFDSFGFSSEEQKIMKETKKILKLKNTSVSAQTVRVPVENAHAESVWVTFENKVELSQMMSALENQEGLYINKTNYDTQLEVSGKDGVFVSRVRQDLDNPNRWLFWLISDNIRKGAATNAVQIAEALQKII